MCRKASYTILTSAFTINIALLRPTSNPQSNHLTMSARELRPRPSVGSSIKRKHANVEVETVADSDVEVGVAKTSSSISVGLAFNTTGPSTASASGANSLGTGTPVTPASVSDASGSRRKEKRKADDLADNQGAAAEDAGAQDDNPIVFTKKICRDTADIVAFLVRI